MKRCLCCGKEIESASDHGWHHSCIRSFFGTEHFPELDFSNLAFDDFAKRETGNGRTVPGVQKKISLQLSKTPRKERLTLVDCPSGYILKPQSPDYPFLPELEYLSMQMAEIAGIKTVPYSLIQTSGENPTFAYLTKRVDRENGKRLAMEDFCQLDLRLTEDKYRGSYERCAKVIKRYSSSSTFDLTELFLRVLFSFAIGNSDMHLKNFSLLEKEEGAASYSLSPAYDMLSTNLVLPSDTEELALTLNGKNRHLRRKDFLLFASSIGLPRKAAEKMIEKIVRTKDALLRLSSESYLPEKMKDELSHLIEKRIGILCGEL